MTQLSMGNPEVTSSILVGGNVCVFFFNIQSLLASIYTFYRIVVRSCLGLGLALHISATLTCQWHVYSMIVE